MRNSRPNLGLAIPGLKSINPLLMKSSQSCGPLALFSVLQFEDKASLSVSLTLTHSHFSLHFCSTSMLIENFLIALGFLLACCGVACFFYPSRRPGALTPDGRALGASRAQQSAAGSRPPPRPDRTGVRN